MIDVISRIRIIGTFAYEQYGDERVARIDAAYDVSTIPGQTILFKAFGTGPEQIDPHFSRRPTDDEIRERLSAGRFYAYE